MSKRKSFLFGALGVVGTLITTFIAFLLFLGGISGMGNETLLTLAMVVFALPVVLPTLFGLIKVVVKVSEEQRFKGEVDADQTPREPLGFMTIFKRIAIGALLIVLTVAGLLTYEYVSRLEPSLVQAVIDGDVDELERLLESGKDPNQLSHSGATPLMTSLVNERRPTNDIVALLLEYGADPDQPSHKAYQPHSYVNYRRTPVVVIATQRSHLGPDALRLLIENGVDLNPARAHQTESSPMISALSSNKDEMVAMMQAAGARLQARDDGDVQRMLYWAVDNRNVEIVRMLIAEDADGGLVSSAMHWVEYHWKEKSCGSFYSTLARLLMEESNRRGGERPYPESAMACVRT